MDNTILVTVYVSPTQNQDVVHQAFGFMSTSPSICYPIVYFGATLSEIYANTTHRMSPDGIYGSPKAPEDVRKESGQARPLEAHCTDIGIIACP